MRIRAPPGREESMERTKDFYNGMDYAKNNYSNGNMKDAEEIDISLSRNYAGLRHLRWW